MLIQRSFPAPATSVTKISKVDQVMSSARDIPLENNMKECKEKDRQLMRSTALAIAEAVRTYQNRQVDYGGNFAGVPS